MDNCKGAIWRQTSRRYDDSLMEVEELDEVQKSAGLKEISVEERSVPGRSTMLIIKRTKAVKVGLRDPAQDHR